MSSNERVRMVGNELIAILVLTGLMLSVVSPGYAQRHRRDSSFRHFNIKNLDDTLIPLLANRVASYTFTINRDSFLLSKDYDLLPIEDQLPGLETRIKSFHSIFSKQGQKMNLRGLNTSTIILKDIVTKLSGFQDALRDYRDTLKASNSKIRHILRDSALRAVAADTSMNWEITDVIQRAHKLNFSQKIMLARINLLNSRVSVNLSETNDLMTDMLFLTINKKANLFVPESGPLFGISPAKYQQATTDNFLQAVSVSWQVIRIYVLNRIKIFSVIITLFVLFFILLLFRLQKLGKKSHHVSADGTFLSSAQGQAVGYILLVFTITPLFFSNPPAAVSHFFDVLQLTALTILVVRLIPPRTRWIWFFFAVLSVVFILDDLLLRESFGERWIVFISSLLSIGIYLLVIANKSIFFKEVGYSPMVQTLLIATGVMFLASVIFNLTGNFSLSKILGVTAIQAPMVALILKVLITQASESFGRLNLKSSILKIFNFSKPQSGAAKIMWVFAAAVWLISVLKNLTVYNYAVFMSQGFLFKTRTLGQYHYTYSSVIAFFLILWITSFISRIISYWLGHDGRSVSGKATRLNSLSLIFRLFVWTAGFLIGVAAAGIPLDKISILLGALGVGIGFGLQNIVNNIVSGIILAFEHPIRPGDQIEVGGKTGIVREIGIRASKINNTMGADIIIPNGDLLSQQLINWTMQNKNKLVSFTMAVPYDTNLNRIKDLIVDDLKRQDDILQDPMPSLIVSRFSQTGIEIKILFWAPDLFNIDSIRSRVMIDIKEMLRKEGVRLQPPVFGAVIPPPDEKNS